jgi:hypothetical protein
VVNQHYLEVQGEHAGKCDMAAALAVAVAKAKAARCSCLRRGMSTKHFEQQNSSDIAVYDDKTNTIGWCPVHVLNAIGCFVFVCFCFVLVCWFVLVLFCFVFVFVGFVCFVILISFVLFWVD